MNHLPVADENEWYLPPHAQIIVGEVDPGEELITIYDCAAAQKPPSARLIGNLVRVDAEHELVYQARGYIVKLREKARLERQANDHWVVRTDATDRSSV